MLRRALRILSIVTAFVAATLASSGIASAKTCTAFGCSPGQGNPIQELAGMVVTTAIVAALLFGAARRYVK